MSFNTEFAAVKRANTFAYVASQRNLRINQEMLSYKSGIYYWAKLFILFIL